MNVDKPVVIDTNIVLDLWLFADASVQLLRTELQARRLKWLATPEMRAELARVLTYPHLQMQLLRHTHAVDEVLERFDTYAQIQTAAPQAPWACQDEDDQKFIDLALAHRAVLLSKDLHVLAMNKAFMRQGLSVRRAW